MSAARSPRLCGPGTMKTPLIKRKSAETGVRLKESAFSRRFSASCGVPPLPSDTNRSSGPMASCERSK